MIKVETLGMIQGSVMNPTITSDADVKNYDFITVDGDIYLVSNTITGDDAYKEDVTIKAGDCLNAFLVKAWEGQKLVVDGKHVVDGIAGIHKNDVLVVNAQGKLEAGEAEGVHFVVTDIDATLTEKAIKVKVAVASEATE